jgi:hypothetical protein
MSLHFELMIGRNVIGFMEIQRMVDLDLMNKAAIADVVSPYQVTVQSEHARKPRRIGTVEHRYGDGAWVLLAKALELYNSKKR